MVRRLKFAMLVIGTPAACFAMPAIAQTYSLDLTGAGATLSATLDASGFGDSRLITALSGTFNGLSISIVAPGGVTLLPTNDNMLFPNATGKGYVDGTMGYFDGNGLGFSAGGVIYNLYYGEAAAPSYFIQRDKTSFIEYSGNVTINPLPETANWAMMISGMGAIGYVTRRRKLTARVSYVA